MRLFFSNILQFNYACTNGCRVKSLLAFFFVIHVPSHTFTAEKKKKRKFCVDAAFNSLSHPCCLPCWTTLFILSVRAVANCSHLFVTIQVRVEGGCFCCFDALYAVCVVFMTFESSRRRLEQGAFNWTCLSLYFFWVVLDAFQMHYCTIFQLYFRFFLTPPLLWKKSFPDFLIT